TQVVAIYQALRFDFDTARAVARTLPQVARPAAVVACLARLGADMTGDATLTVAPRRLITSPPAGTAPAARVILQARAAVPVAPRRFITSAAAGTALDGMVILLALAFVAGPMLATVAAGLRADLLRLAGEEAVRRATLTSVVLALLSALLAAVLSLSLAMGR